MNYTLLETIQTLQHQAERLEHDAAELRQALADIAEVLVSPSSVIARYQIEGESYEITQSDVDSAKAGLAKPWTENALYELAAIKKVANKLREHSSDEQNQYFFKTVESIQETTLTDKTAIETKAEIANDG